MQSDDGITAASSPTPRLNVSRRPLESDGQAMVEFSLVIGLALVLITAVIEFGLGFNALLSINFASRDAALAGAKAGNVIGADCLILTEIEQDVGSPADPNAIQSVEIFWSDNAGQTKSGATNLYARSGSTTCLYAGGKTVTVPYSLTSGSYVDAGRCNVIEGCGGLHEPTVDTIGVRIAYDYPWHTPLSSIFGLIGGGPGFDGAGWSLAQTNAMRMEPVL